jgi:general stress protein YciG
MANTSKRGFASMDPSRQREIASKGGRAAHAKGTAHEFTSDEARVAGRKGGEAVSRDRAHMSAIGREGGHSRGRARQDGGQNADSSGAQSGQSANTASAGMSARESNERPSYIGQEHGSDRGFSSQNTGGSSNNASSSGSGQQRSGENNSRDMQGNRGY